MAQEEFEKAMRLLRKAELLRDVMTSKSGRSSTHGLLEKAISHLENVVDAEGGGRRLSTEKE